MLREYILWNWLHKRWHGEHDSLTYRALCAMSHKMQNKGLEFKIAKRYV